LISATSTEGDPARPEDPTQDSQGIAGALMDIDPGVAALQARHLDAPG